MTLATGKRTQSTPVIASPETPLQVSTIIELPNTAKVETPVAPVAATVTPSKRIPSVSRLFTADMDLEARVILLENAPELNATDTAMLPGMIADLEIEDALRAAGIMNQSKASTEANRLELARLEAEEAERLKNTPKELTLEELAEIGRQAVADRASYEATQKSVRDMEHATRLEGHQAAGEAAKKLLRSNMDRKLNELARKVGTITMLSPQAESLFLSSGVPVTVTATQQGGETVDIQATVV